MNELLRFKPVALFIGFLLLTTSCLKEKQKLKALGYIH
jgi:hypothetical protein